MAFRPIIAATELWDGDMIARRVDGQDVLLVRLNGVVYAYENRCAHHGRGLERGAAGRTRTYLPRPPLAV